MKTIESIRDEFDKVDKALVTLLEKRFSLSRQIAVVKRAEGMMTQDPSREVQVIKNVVNNLEDDSFDAAILTVFDAIIKASKDIQREEEE